MSMGNYRYKPQGLSACIPETDSDVQIGRPATCAEWTTSEGPVSPSALRPPLSEPAVRSPAGSQELRINGQAR
ncbi:hypothetical protein GE21DRAFT_1211570 [Neurospora crassa]|nr:hypothetical protein GE21DRAFT_1211570 [Neurospora crassa]